SLSERGFAAVALSGEHSQNERNQALQALRDRRARVCVATDVAARGIDLPTLSLVVHVEMPRDAETLQHRSGRTGRAGKKGTAVLIVPYPRRKRVEMMLRSARIAAEWVPVPSADDIRAKDRDRLIEALSQPVEPDPDDWVIGEELLKNKSPQEIAAALVHAHRAAMPAPEEMIDRVPEGPKAHHRQGFDDTVWFRMNIGRRQNADPRWILPLICRRGGITKNEVGAIRIQANETGFQIPRAIAARFAQAVAKSAGADGEDDSGVRIEPVDGAAPSGPPARRTLHRAAPSGDGQVRRQGPPPGRGRPPHAHRKGPRPNKGPRPQS
ncbi:MAG: helicase-related protein, partial [Sphingomonas sp.]|uniref:helicase-related protein n=1 Tax=Sphingomonas sp. TaxID=28214 RepID=UPI003F7ECC87